jgi:hypothetical protein
MALTNRRRPVGPSPSSRLRDSAAIRFTTRAGPSDSYRTAMIGQDVSYVTSVHRRFDEGSHRLRAASDWPLVCCQPSIDLSSTGRPDGRPEGGVERSAPSTLVCRQASVGQSVGVRPPDEKTRRSKMKSKTRKRIRSKIKSGIKMQSAALPSAIQRLTMTVPRNSTNLQPVNEMRVGCCPRGTR